MRNFTFFVIMLFGITKCLGQTDTPKTEIILLGIIHTGNKKFNFKTLYRTIKTNSPDIILWEQNEPFKRVFGLMTAYRLKIAKPTIEQLALQKLTRKDKKRFILGFDTLIISPKNYLKNRIAIKQSFHDNLYSAKKTISDSTIYADFATKHDFYYSFIDTSSLARINRKDIIDKGRELYYLEEKVILPLGKKYISDSLLVNNFSDEVQFWNDRNDYMVNQILNYSKQFEGKKIIILTGLAHKYYLQDKLSDLNIGNLKFIEFTSE